MIQRRVIKNMNPKRKELVNSINEQYNNLKITFGSSLNERVGLSAIFSILNKIVKKGDRNDLEMLQKLITEGLNIIETKIIPDTVKKVIEKGIAQLPDSLKSELNDDFIIALLDKLNNAKLMNYLRNIKVKINDIIISEFGNKSE